MSKLNEEQIERSIRIAEASINIEGQELQAGARKLIELKLSGQISEKDFLRMATGLAQQEE
ncbi:hypothetical protein J2W91_004615 [Paenibacillus amylolyticus]|uniref:Antitoxin VbhA domain-containing protein n=1 Tax=Paenibacillus amylolyticus TaxID=1451 RepID=A0AAP5LSZ6_PAEAM|nr:hypothetical protein [Paenibacillus amylolyticus]MDR6726109.1 hypothetical protein [Paenibacillus amylolyticus]